MRKCLLFSIFIYFSFQLINANAQVKVEKVDSSKIPIKISSFKSPFVPEFPDKEQSVTELFLGIQNQTSLDKPLNIGKTLIFSLNFDSIPKVRKGEKIFKEIEIYSPGSNTLSVNFENIVLSKSAELFIINDEESYILGPIISEDIFRSNNFDPGFIPGDKIRILLVESENESSPSKVQISNIGHIIFDFFGINKFDASKIEGINCYGIDCSSSCLQNITCFTGLDLESKAVALIAHSQNWAGGDVTFHGTGSLVNNGAQNKRALFLAMIHGMSEILMPNMRFIFHYKSPQCSPTTTGSTSYFIQGATQLGIDGPNDLRLLELSTNPGTSRVFTNNPVSYLGWSIIDEPIPNIYGIHHPKGDQQKYLTGGPATPSIVIDGGYSYGVWKYRVTNGFPETISSGSPTFNPQKRVIGLLRGAPVALTCSNFADYDVHSVRLSRSWSLLCQYLDPNNEGIVAMNTITSTPGIKIFPSVDGPNLVCSSSTFTLQNAPIDLSVSWNIVEGASLLNSPASGTGKSAPVSISSPSVSGQVKIRFTVSGLCTNKIFEKTFWVGVPNAAGSITGGTYVYTYHILNYSISPVAGATSYNWQLPNGWTGGGVGLGNSIQVTVGPNSGTIIVTPVNSCGQGQGSTLYVTVNNCQNCREVKLFPTPAKDFLTIIPNDPRIQKDENLELLGYQIFDLNGRLLKSSKEKMIVSIQRIDVRDLPKGIYIIHLEFENGVLAKKILIDR